MMPESVWKKGIESEVKKREVAFKSAARLACDQLGESAASIGSHIRSVDCCWLVPVQFRWLSSLIWFWHATLADQTDGIGRSAEVGCS